MAEINNVVNAKFKQENPSLPSMRRICHSMQLGMLYISAECLPRNLEYLNAETHNWFVKLSVRQYQYDELNKAIIMDQNFSILRQTTKPGGCPSNMP